MDIDPKSYNNFELHKNKINICTTSFVDKTFVLVSLVKYLNKKIQMLFKHLY